MAITIGRFTKILVASSAASGSLPGTSGKFLFTTNTDCYVRFDGDTATSSAYDIFMPKGAALVLRPRSSAAVSVIRATGDGVLSIHEIE